MISEETSEVTLSREGRFIESYDPYADQETLRKEKVVLMKRKEAPKELIDTKIQQEETGTQVLPE